jgi:hypothetical protein
MSSIAVTFYVEPDNELGAAFLMLGAANEYLDEFVREHSERADDNIQQALAHAQAARSLLDSDFYTEHNAVA